MLARHRCWPGFSFSIISSSASDMMMAARLAAIANQCGGIRPGSATPGKSVGSGICELAPIEEQAPSARLSYHRPERSTLSIRPIIYRAYGAVFYFPTIPSLTGAISLTAQTHTLASVVVSQDLVVSCKSAGKKKPAEAGLLVIHFPCAASCSISLAPSRCYANPLPPRVGRASHTAVPTLSSRMR